MTAQEKEAQALSLRRQWQTTILALAVGAVIVSIAYAPYQVSHTDQKTLSYNGFPVVYTSQESQVKYDWFGEPPRNSTIDLARLFVTWVAIAAASALASHANYSRYGGTPSSDRSTSCSSS